VAIAILDEDATIARLGQAIRYETISHSNSARNDEAAFKNFQAFLQEAFPKVHGTLDRFTGAQLGDDRNLSLLYKWRGTNPDAEAILLMAHYDVVPVEQVSLRHWTHKPFSGDLADGYLWGRGTLDDKDGVMGLLEAVEQLLTNEFKPERTIYISLGHDEEVGGNYGNREIAEWMRRQGIKLEFVLDEGGFIFDGVPLVEQPVALVGVAEKGYVSLRLVVEFATGGHSSMPPKETAIGVLAKAIVRLDDNPFPQRLDGGIDLMLDYIGPEMPWSVKLAMANRWLFSGLIRRQFGAKDSSDATLRTTMVTTIVEGGVKENVIPKRAEAVVNVRILPGDHVKGVVESIRKTIGDERVSIELVKEGRNPSPVSSADSDGFRVIHTTVAEIFPGVIVSPFVLVASTDSSHFLDISRDIYRFLPARMSETDLQRLHGVNERISRENYLEVIRFYIRLIENAN